VKADSSRQRVMAALRYRRPEHHDAGRMVRLMDDYNVVCSRRFLIETEEDLAKLPYLLHPLSGDTLVRFREHATAIGREAKRLGVFGALMDIIQAWDRRNLEVLLDTGPGGAHPVAGGCPLSQHTLAECADRDRGLERDRRHPRCLRGGTACMTPAACRYIV